MEKTFQQQFLEKWGKYFPKAELPIVFYYTDEEGRAEYAGVPSRHRCFIGDLAKVRRGKSLCFDVKAVSCSGGKRYLGFSQELRPNFEYFLSCGIEGKLTGERYKKSPELVNEYMKLMEPMNAPGKFIVVKRFDLLKGDEQPVAAIFFATADVLSGLFTLANFDEASSHGVIAPFAAGCGSLIYHPLVESISPHPRAILGMFDVSARPFVDGNVLTFAIPWSKFVIMVGNMHESFLTTDSWKKVRTRIARKTNKVK